jgi:hypothetical protein
MSMASAVLAGAGIVLTWAVTSLGVEGQAGCVAICVRVYQAVLTFSGNDTPGMEMATPSAVPQLLRYT